MEPYLPPSFNPPAGATTAFLRDWLIFRRQLASYPTGHPFIAEGSRRLLGQLELLLSNSDELLLGVTREGFLLGDAVIGKELPPVVQFGRELIRRGLAGIGFRPGVTEEELIALSRLTIGPPEAFRLGSDTPAEIMSLPHVSLTLLDYSIIETSEVRQPSADAPGTSAGDFWQQLVTGLLSGGRPGSESAEAEAQLLALARTLAAEFARLAATGEGPTASAPLGWLQQQLLQNLPAGQPQSASLFLAAFFQQLAPDLCHQLLASAAVNLGEENTFLETLLRRLPAPLLAELLRAERTLSPDRAPPLLRVLERLQKSAGTGQRRSLAADPEAVERLQTLLREDTSELYIPADYQQSLHQLQRTPDSSGALAELEALKATLDSRRLESKLCTIILEVARHLPPEEQTALLSNNLREICSYFLELGDFSALNRLHDQLQHNLARAGGDSRRVAEQALAAFEQPQFIEDVLAAIQIWGKPKYEEVKQFIQRLGRPFIDPLLAALASENGLSLRRYYMECLTEMGRIIRPFLLAQLTDSRWYFVRNLVVLLRELNNPEVLQYLEPLREHEHIRVRQEVLRTFLHHDDPRAVKTLLQELGSGAPEEQLAAIRMAGKSRSPAVQRRLVALLGHRAQSADGLRLQSALLHALAEIGDATVLPALRRLYGSWNLLHPRLQKRLRVEIARSLGGYPAESVSSWLEQLAGARHRPVAEAAHQARAQLQRRRS